MSASISNPSEIVSFELFSKTKVSFFWQYIDYLRAILIMMVISDALSIMLTMIIMLTIIIIIRITTITML